MGDCPKLQDSSAAKPVRLGPLNLEWNESGRRYEIEKIVAWGRYGMEVGWGTK